MKAAGIILKEEEWVRSSSEVTIYFSRIQVGKLQDTSQPSADEGLFVRSSNGYHLLLLRQVLQDTAYKKIRRITVSYSMFAAIAHWSQLSQQLHLWFYNYLNYSVLLSNPSALLPDWCLKKSRSPSAAWAPTPWCRQTWRCLFFKQIVCWGGPEVILQPFCRGSFLSLKPEP